MKGPVIVDESGDVLIFASAKDAEIALEPIDIENEEYIIYSADGSKLVASIYKEKHKAMVVKKVSLKQPDTQSIHADELRYTLKSFLERAKVVGNGELDNEDLEYTLRVFIEEIGYAR